MSWFRKPDKIVTIDVQAPAVQLFTTYQRYLTFVELCSAYHLELMESQGTIMVLKGRPKNVDRFLVHVTALQKVGAV